MSNEKTEKKVSTVRFGFISAKTWLIWAIPVILISTFAAWLYWLVKTRFYIHSLGSMIIPLFAMIAIAGTTYGIYKHENSNYYYDHRYDRNYERKSGVDSQKSIFVIAVIAITVIFAVYAFGGAIISGGMFNSHGYYTHVQQRTTVITDTEEVSAFPNLLGETNDTSNLPLIGIPEAMKKAETEMGRFPALGSQFELLSDDMTTQIINGELCYVIPLQPKSMFKWDKNVGNHGYFIIDRNNGKTTFVETSLMTTTEAPFGSSAKRIINKYMNSMGIEGLVTDISPEVDDEGNFHYVATVYTLHGVSGYETVKGIIELDAVTKNCKFYNMNEIPEYVDRVYPEEFFENYLSYYGAYKNGWWNSWIGQKEVQEATDGMDVIYIDGICYYYTGWTSAGKHESSNGIMMMNSRTGEITQHITYGISEKKAQERAQGIVQEKEYVASYPLLLQVAGNETYFMLMRDSGENLVGYAFVNYKDYTKAAVGTTLREAQANYVKSLATSNNASDMDESMTKTISGKITHITSEVVDGNTIYYVKVEGSNVIFQMYSKLDVKIVFAVVGDEISIDYFDSGSDVETATGCKIK